MRDYLSALRFAKSMRMKASVFPFFSGISFFFCCLSGDVLFFAVSGKPQMVGETYYS